MKVTIKVKEEIKEVEKFPCLKITEDDDVIVLFNSPKEGTVIRDIDGRYTVGHHSIYWDHGGFRPYNGSITLQND